MSHMTGGTDKMSAEQYCGYPSIPTAGVGPKEISVETVALVKPGWVRLEHACATALQVSHAWS